MSEGETRETPAEAGAAASEPDPLVGRVIADRYRIDARIGVGGMGAVYRAEHVLMRKSVAVKVLHREMTVQGEVVKRFEREAIAAGRIEHPNVTVATDFGKLEDGAFYLVLEYVPGKSLTRVLEDEGPFTTERAFVIARQVAAALGAAHAAGIVHRDLKPDNIMLIERGGAKDFVKVLDFGIAKIAEGVGGSPLTRLGSVFGTPAYMAPEQAAGQAVDGRADLYALGLVLYEMLAGRPAFVADELVALLTKQLTEPPPPLPDAIDVETRALVVRLLEKDPALRIQSAPELVAIIEARLGPLALPPDSSALGAPSARSASFAQVAAATAPALTPPERRARSVAATTLMRLSSRGQDLVARALRGETVPVAGRELPLWLLGAAAGAALMGVVLTLGIVGGAKGPAPHSSAHAPLPPPPEISPLIGRASEGDRAAVAALAARPEATRLAIEWAAIGKGRSKLGEQVLAIDALRRAVAKDPELASDRSLLECVRKAADDDKAQKAALEFAAGPLGEGGADVLFDVWASTVERTETTALAKTFLDRDTVREHASAPLRLALELRRQKRCDDVKKLVDRAKEIADERAFRPLNQLSARSGCGFLGLADCYSCLRQGDALQEALKAAQQRKGPRF